MPYKDPVKQKAARDRHYQENKEKWAERRRSRKTLLRRYIVDSKGGKPCTDCGVTYPYYVMDYDHVGADKEFDLAEISKGKGKNWDKKFKLSQVSSATTLDAVKTEIAKCELVCANCHRERTHQRSIADQ